MRRTTAPTSSGRTGVVAVAILLRIGGGVVVMVCRRRENVTTD
ncbi:hypothetical protein ACI3KS_14225 [Microbacterium sp. ZW T5_45]